MHLHMLLTEIAKRDIQKRMEQAERSMKGGSAYYRAAQQAGTVDPGQRESEFWQQKIQEAQANAKRDAEQESAALRAQLCVQMEENKQLEEKIQHIVELQDKKNAAAMKAYNSLMEDLSRTEAEGVLEFQKKAEALRKAKQLAMVNNYLKDEVEQLTQQVQALEEALSAAHNTQLEGQGGCEQAQEGESRQALSPLPVISS